MEGDTDVPGTDARIRSRVFKSCNHPADRSPASVYGRALVRPLAAGMLPLMIITLVAFLEGHPALAYFLAGAAVVIVLSSVWTSFQLKRTVAAVHVADDSAAVVTVWDVLDSAADAEWAPVFDLREQHRAITATVGYVTYTFEAKNWPHFGEMTDTLVKAREKTFKELSQLHRERREQHP